MKVCIICFEMQTSNFCRPTPRDLQSVSTGSCSAERQAMTGTLPVKHGMYLQKHCQVDCQVHLTRSTAVCAISARCGRPFFFKRTRRPFLSIHYSFKLNKQIILLLLLLLMLLLMAELKKCAFQGPSFCCCCCHCHYFYYYH